MPWGGKLMDTSLILAILGSCLSVATFFVGRQSAAKSDGREMGGIMTELKYIKESIKSLDDKLGDDVKRLEGRVDELSGQVMGMGKDITKIYESSKSAHKRIDEHIADKRG